MTRSVSFWRHVSLESDVPADLSQELWDLFSPYYTHVTRELFQADLRDKTGVCLALGPRDEAVGFMTYRRLTAPKRLLEGNAEVLFCGNTVLHKDYWGAGIGLGSVLAQEQRARWLGEHHDYYLYSIMQGWRTYRFFFSHLPISYPGPAHVEDELHGSLMGDPAIDRLRSLRIWASRELFGSEYCEQSARVVYEDAHERVDPTVAGVTQEVLDRDEFARAFVRLNPNHAAGEEIPAIALIDRATSDLLLQAASWLSLGDHQQPVSSAA